MTHELTYEREAFEAWWAEFRRESWRAASLPSERGTPTPEGWGSLFKNHAWEAWKAALLAHLAQRGTSDLTCVCGALWEHGQHGWELVAASPQAQPMPEGVEASCPNCAGWKLLAESALAAAESGERIEAIRAKHGLGTPGVKGLGDA